jgi:hypothetical protein
VNIFSSAKEYSIHRITRTPLRTDPFPHLVVNEVFPPTLYAEMQRLMLADTDYVPLVETGRVAPNYSPERLCFAPPRPGKVPVGNEAVKFWAELCAAYNDLAFLHAWLGAFQNAVAERARQDPEMFPDNMIDVKSEFLLMRDLQNYALNPHTDVRSKLISVLFYLPPDDSDIMLGTSLYTLKDKSRVTFGGVHEPRDGFDLVATLPFRANTLLAFPNLKGSFHGVEPVEGAATRRDVLLYDIKLAGRGTPA